METAVSHRAVEPSGLRVSARTVKSPTMTEVKGTSAPSATTESVSWSS
jgi:hypothetical protein